MQWEKKNPISQGSNHNANSGHGSGEVAKQPSGRKRLTLAQDGRRAKTRGGAWGGTDLEEQKSREEITGVSETLRSQSHLGIKAKGGGGRETGQPAL